MLSQVVRSGERMVFVSTTPGVRTRVGIFPRVHVGVAFEVVRSEGGVAAIGEQADVNR